MKNIRLVLIIIAIVLLFSILILLLWKLDRKGSQSMDVDLSTSREIDFSLLSKPQTTKPLTFFDNFDSAKLNEERWFTWPQSASSVVIQESGKLAIKVLPGGDSHGVAAILRGIIKGDFGIEVEVDVVDTGADSLTRVIFHDEAEGWPNSLELHFENEESSVLVSAVSVLDKKQSVRGSEIFDGSGPFKVKLLRNGREVTFIVNEMVIAQTEDNDNSVFLGDGMIALTLDSSEPDRSVSAVFDNFRIR
jgi:hypothetical protein